MSEVDTYQQLIEKVPELQEAAHKEAFDKYIEGMWAKPSSLRNYFQAYLEFTTPKKLTFSKLNDLHTPKKETSRPAPQKKRRRRSRRGRRRSSNQRKQN